MSDRLYTLSKEERLHGKNDISRLLDLGHFGSVPGMKYCFFKGNGLDCNRILISVPKKLFKRAVKRNLMKRRIRENFRHLKTSLTGGSGTDILFIWNSKETPGTAEITPMMESVIKKVNAYEK